MTDFPLPTLAPTIDATGITTPTYSDVLASLQASARGVFGQDIVLDDDSQDGQLLAVFAKAIYDASQAMVSVFVSFSPSFAQGAQLSSLVKINGIARLVSSNSSVPVDVGGQAGTLIVNGSVRDANGVVWTLPASFNIPDSGVVTETATAVDVGELIAVEPFTIATPTRGWQTAVASGSTSPGAPVELDAALRRRQAASTGDPAQTPLEAIVGAIANVPGVTRYALYENDTAATDANGVPSHSVSAVVQGGDAVALATVIARKKSPGTGTYGTTSETITDQYGLPVTIRFFVLAAVALKALVYVKALTGYVSTTSDAMKASASAFVGALDIGTDSYVSNLYSPLKLSGDVAVTATGQTQAQLDVLSRTFNLLQVYQSRPNMTTTAGPYGAGSVNITMTSAANYSIGQAVAVILDNNAVHRTTLTNVVGAVITLAVGVPGGRTVPNGKLVYVAGDVVVAFNEGAALAVADVDVEVS